MRSLGGWGASVCASFSVCIFEREGASFFVVFFGGLFGVCVCVCVCTLLTFSPHTLRLRCVTLHLKWVLSRPIIANSPEVRANHPLGAEACPEITHR